MNKNAKNITAVEADLLAALLATTELAIVRESKELSMTATDVKNCVRRAAHVETQDATRHVTNDTICKIPLISV